MTLDRAIKFLTKAVTNLDRVISDLDAKKNLLNTQISKLEDEFEEVMSDRVRAASIHKKLSDILE